MVINVFWMDGTTDAHTIHTKSIESGHSHFVTWHDLGTEDTIQWAKQNSIICGRRIKRRANRHHHHHDYRHWLMDIRTKVNEIEIRQDKKNWNPSNGHSPHTAKFDKMTSFLHAARITIKINLKTNNTFLRIY